MRRRVFLRRALAATGATVGAVARPVHAQEPIRLRVSHFVPAAHVVHTMLLGPWAQRIEKDSGGRIKCELYPSMQLGGKPQQLVDQVRAGVADLVWTVPAYTPGRFPLSAVFELPFVVGSTAEATSRAIWSFYQKHLRDEYKDVHPLLLHCHAPGVMHMKDSAVQRLEDVAGKKLRLPSKPLADAFRLIGATPVGMPASEAYEALSRGVVQGVTLPWEAVKSFRLNELARFHTIAEIYTTVFLVAMNRQKYESLPADLRSVIDRNSGDNWIAEAGRIWDAAEGPGLQQARESGHTIVELSADEKIRWKRAMQSVVDEWIATTPNGKALYADATAFIARQQ